MTTSQQRQQASIGLTSADARQRLKQYGYNEVTERSEPLWYRIFPRFWGPTALAWVALSDGARMITLRVLRRRGIMANQRPTSIVADELTIRVGRYWT